MVVDDGQLEHADDGEFDEGSTDSDAESDDRELQEAFAKGEINTDRLNRLVQFVRRDVIKNVDGLNQALKGFSTFVPLVGSTGLPWIERLDVNNDPAPVAPELAAHLDSQVSNQTGQKSVTDDDFKREVTFYRQAQAAVLEGLPRIRALGLPTRRPEDYFAQMLKSDDHMQKVREVLVNKQLVMEKREKARKLRELKKYGKQVQTEVLLRRAKEKREALDSVKKFRRGQKDKLDFLEDNVSGLKKRDSEQNKPQQHQHQKETKNKKQKQPKGSVRRKAKDAKYGFGGKKKRGKYNDAESSADVSSYRLNRGGKGGQSKKSSGARRGNDKSGFSRKQVKGGGNRRKRS